MAVTLFVPGLFSAFKEIAPADINALGCRQLAQLLSHAKKQAAPMLDSEHWLFQQFHDDDVPADSIPTAAITALLDGLDSQNKYWMRADPVFLYPDTHSLILQDPDQLALNEAEIQLIKQLIGPLFNDYGAELLTPHQCRWYLRFDSQAPNISCAPLYDALSKPVNTYLPIGDDQRRWHTLFNEIQMLLNSSDVNSQRESGRLPPVNSLWFWGEGVMPDTLKSSYASCIGNDDLLAGLCLATETSYSELASSDIKDMDYENATLIVDKRLRHAVRINSPEQWLLSLQKLELETVAPLIEAVKQGRINYLTLVDSEKAFRFGWLQSRIFWKPVRSLSSLLV